MVSSGCGSGSGRSAGLDVPNPQESQRPAGSNEQQAEEEPLPEWCSSVGQIQIALEGRLDADPTLTDAQIAADLFLSSPFVVRGRVGSAGQTVHTDGDERMGYQYFIIEVSEYVSGDAATVLPAFRTRFPLVVLTSHMSGDADASLPETIEPNLVCFREDLLFVVSLPTESGYTSTREFLPREVEREFGQVQVTLRAFFSPASVTP